MNTRGSTLVFLIVIVLIAIIAESYFFYANPKLDLLSYLPQNLTSFTNLKTSFIPPMDWKTATNDTYNLTFHYPPNWQISEEGIVSQNQLPVYKTAIASNKVYNFITLDSHTGVNVNGFYDQDLFEKVAGLKVGESFKPD